MNVALFFSGYWQTFQLLRAKVAGQRSLYFFSLCFPFLCSAASKDILQSELCCQGEHCCRTEWRKQLRTLPRLKYGSWVSFLRFQFFRQLGGGKQEALKEMPRRGRADVLTTPSLSHSLASRSFTTKRHRAFPWEHRGPNMPSYNTLHMCTHVCNTHTNTHTGTVLWGQGGAFVSRPPFLLRLSSSFGVKGG